MSSASVTSARAGSARGRLIEAEKRLAALEPGSDAYLAELQSLMGIRVGAPQKRPPINAVMLLEQYAREGRPLAGIAAKVGVAKETLRQWLIDYEDLRAAIDRGREDERHELHSILVNNARDGEKPNVNAMFILKTKHGYREGEAMDNGVPRLSITFNVPGALSRDEFMKSVVSDERGQ